MPARTIYENAVCPSVSPSVKGMDCDKRNKFCPDFYTIRKIIQPSFVRKKVVGGMTLSTWNFGSNWPRWSENADFQSIFARSASAVASSKKSSINTNRMSITRFPTNEIKMNIVTQNGRFPTKIALCLKKVCYKVSFVKTVSDKVLRHSLAHLSMRKWLVGRPLLRTWKFGGYWFILPLQNADFQFIFARSASEVTSSKKAQLTLIECPLRAFQ